MRYKTPKNHIYMTSPYDVTDVGETPATISWSYSAVYGSKPQMCSGKRNKYGIYQSGYNQYVRAATGTLTYPFTWCAWLKKDAHTDTSYPIFMSYGLPYMACNGSTSPFRFSYINQAGSQVNLNGTTIPALNTWYHVAVTDDGTTIKLYVDGALERSSTDNMRSAGSSNSSFDIGRHYNSNTYRIVGATDDIRVYDEVLSQTEIQSLVSLTKDERVLEITSSGDVILTDWVDEDYDWKLLSSFASNLSGEYPWYEDGWPWRISASGGRIRSTTELTADGWTRYLTTINTSSYSRYRGYMQFFYSSSPIGYIYRYLPQGEGGTQLYSRIRVRWGNWYTGSSYLDLGVNTSFTNKQALGSSAGMRDYEANLGSYNTIRFRESGITWPGEIWLGNTKTYSGLTPTKADFKFVRNTGISNPRILSDGVTFEYPGKLIVR